MLLCVPEHPHGGLRSHQRKSFTCSCTCTHVSTPSVSRWCKRKVKTRSSFVICLYCPGAACRGETLGKEKIEGGIVPGKCLYLFLSHLRIGINESREIRHKAFLNNFTSLSLFRSLPRMELTLGLPRLPLSNGCMFQGKYPTERRTWLHGYEDLSPEGSAWAAVRMNGGERGCRTVAATCSQACWAPVTPGDHSMKSWLTHRKV